MTSFVAASDQGVKGAWTALEIAISQPSSLTLYLATGPLHYSTTYYQGGILEIGQLRAKNAGGVGAVSTFAVTIANQRIYNQSADQDDVAADLLDGYRLLGAVVTRKEYYLHTNGTIYVDVVFTGTVTEIHDITKDSITLEIDRDDLDDAPLPRYKIERKTFPYAHDQAIGEHIPIAIGSFQADAAAANSTQLGIIASAMGYPSALVPVVMYNDNAGTSPNFVDRFFITEHVSGHLLKSVDDMSVMMIFPDLNGAAIGIYPDTSVDNGTLQNENGGVYYQVAEHYRMQCFMRLSDTSGTGAVASDNITGLSLLLDNNLDNYATIDNGQEIFLRLPDAPELGRIFPGDSAYPNYGIALRLWVAPGGSNNVKVELTNSAAGRILTAAASTFSANPASEAAGVYRHTLLYSAWPNGWDGSELELWKFGVNENGTWMRIFKDDAGSARLRAAWLDVIFYPNVPASKAVNTYAGPVYNLDGSLAYTITDDDRRKQRELLYSHAFLVTQLANTPAALMLKSEKATATNFYFCGKSYQDDGSGTYTGSAFALIQNPADVIRFLAVKIGGLAGARMNTAASTIGSFPDARADVNLLTDAVSGGATYNMAILINNDTTVMSAAQDILSMVPMRMYSDRDNVIKLVAWNSAPATNQAERIYRTTFTWKDHIVEDSFRCGLTQLSQIINEVYINYSFDRPSGSSRRTSFVTATTSDDGGGTADSTRQTACSNSQTAHRFKRRFSLDASWINDRYTATALRNYYLDRFKNPKVLIECELSGTAGDLELGHIIQFSSDLDTHIPFPGFGGNGTWAGVYFELTKCDFRVDERRGNIFSIAGTEL